MPENPNKVDLFTALRTVLGWLDFDKLREAADQSPNWVVPLFYYQRYVDQDRVFAHCARRGVEYFVGAIERKTEKTTEDHIRQMIAEKEVNDGFPGINAHHTASLWNMVDVTLSDMLTILFATKPEALALRGLRKVSFSVSEYEQLPKLLRMRIAVTELKRELVRTGSPKLRNGVAVYEEILQQLGATERAMKDLLKTMTELRAMRNIIVHNMGIADDQFADQCPWLRIAPGSSVKVAEPQYEGYVNASGQYLILTFTRLLARFPEPHSPAASEEDAKRTVESIRRAIFRS